MSWSTISTCRRLLQSAALRSKFTFMENIRCNCCGELLPTTSFYVKTNGSLNKICKNCILKKKAENYRKKTGSTKEYKSRNIKMIPLDGEEWREIQYNKRTFLVSSLGRVARKNNYGDIYLYSQLTDNGYKRIHSKERIRVHRLVVTAFISEIPEGMEVNHINGNRGDNRVENLEIVTPRENVLHSINVLGHIRKGNLGRMGKNNKRSKAIICYNEFGEFEQKYYGISDAARSLGCSTLHIQRVCSGKQIAYRGKIWRYETSPNTVTIKKDSKGPCYILNHKRCGISECLFLTLEELRAVKAILNNIL